MKTIAGIPVFEIEFDKDGKLFDTAQVTALNDDLTSKGVTDLVLFAHGWNNDIKDARDLYTRYFTEVGTLVSSGQPAGLADRTFAGAVALWPSKKFTDKELIPGGAASLSAAETAAVRAQLKALSKEPTRLGKATPVGAAKQKKIDRATALLKTIETDAKAQEQFVEIIRSLLSDKAAHADDGTKDFFKVDAKVLLHGLRQPVLATAAVGGGGAAGLGIGGGAAGLGDIANSITAGARRLLNFTTYYQMKERAGTVGTIGVAAVIRKLRQKLPKLRMHLVGHSFGGRVVTAAADAASAAADKINTLTLLQAAYSHNGLAQKFDGKNDGFFRKIVTGKKVLGPIVVTCTKNDNAVGIAYPLASRLGGQNAAALGDANDPYGGIGRNGAVKTPESVSGVLAAANTPYQFKAGHIYNLNSDAVIKDHSDICKPQVAWAMLSAIAVS
jgi:hypothetical protein